MISMTAYWQQFNECIDNLQISTQDKEYSKQLFTAKNLIEIGLKIEQLGITEISAVVNKLHEKAKLFEHEVVYTTDKTYTFYLPKITSIESLMFSILYYQHLTNYKNVDYQGEISWFRKKVIDGINKQKITTAIQTKALLQEIQKYCQQQNYNLDESLFLRTEQESVKNYTSRISEMLTKLDKSSLQEEQVSVSTNTKPDDITILENADAELKNKWNKIKIKTDIIIQKQIEFNQAKEKHQTLTKDWQNKWFVTKAFYRFISLFIDLPEIKNLDIAEKQLIKAESELNQALPHHSPEFYISKLQKHLDKLKSDQEKIQILITRKKEKIQQIQKEETNISIDESLISSTAEKVIPTVEIKEVTEVNELSSNNDYYGFFKRHMPNRNIIEAVAVGAVAVIVQNLL